MLLPSGVERAWAGNYTSIAAATLKAPVEGNRSVPVEIVWSRDGQAPSYAVRFNAREQRVSPMSQIAAVHISNLHSTVPVRLLFPDTGFEIELGIGLEGFYPVVTNGLEFLAYVPLAPAAGDACTIQVLNFLPPPVLNGGTSSGGGSAGVLRVDTGPGLTGGPITDVGTVSLASPVPINLGGTGSTTPDGALDQLVGTSGATTGMITRDAAGAYSLSPVPSGSGPTLPLVVAQGGTGSTTGFGGLDNLSQAGTQTGVLQRAANGAWSLSTAGTGTVTNVLPGVGLTGGGTGPTVTLSLANPVPVNLGGTGASTAAGALANLGGAPIASPVLTGAPKAPTPTAGDNSANIATTAFVQNAVSGGVGGYLPLSGGTLSGSLTVDSTAIVGGAVDQSPYQFLVRGATNGVRVSTSATQAAVEATLNTGAGAYVPLVLGGSTVTAQINGSTQLRIDATGKTIASNFQSTGTLVVDANAFFNNWVDVQNGMTVRLNAAGQTNGSGNSLSLYDDGDGHVESSTTLWLNSVGKGPTHIGGQLIVENSRIAQNAPGGQDCVFYQEIAAQAAWVSGIWTSTISPGAYNITCVYPTSMAAFWADSTGAVFCHFGSFGALSDPSLKQDVKPFSRGLDAIKNLSPVEFRYKPGTPYTTDDEPSDARIGLMADEVFPYVPEACGETTILMGGVETQIGVLQAERLIYPLINAVKELAMEVESLKAQLAELKPTSGGNTH